MKNATMKTSTSFFLFLLIIFSSHLNAQLNFNTLSDRKTNLIADFDKLTVTYSTSGDVDNDGDADLFVCGKQGSQKFGRLFLNDGEGNFSFAQEFWNMYCHTMFADMNGDGWLDLVRGVSVHFNTQQGSGVIFGSSSNNVSVLPNSNGANEFDVGDVDMDGDLDIILLGKSNPLYMNDGLGNFSSSSLEITPRYSGAINFCDIDADGDMDVVQVGKQFPGPTTTEVKFEIYRNNGDLSNLELLDSTFLSGTVINIEAAHLNDDDYIDLLLRDSIYYGDASGLFTNRESIDNTESFVGTNLAQKIDSYLINVNSDTLLDIMIRGPHEYGWYRHYLNNGDGTYSRLQDSIFLYPNLFVEPIDVNNDGFDDFFHERLFMSLYINNQNNHFDIVFNSPLGQRVPENLVWEDLTGDGNLELITIGESANFTQPSDSSRIISFVLDSNNNYLGKDTIVDLWRNPNEQILFGHISSSTEKQLLALELNQFAYDSTIKIVTIDVDNSGDMTISNAQHAIYYPTGIALFDFNNDGFDDLIYGTNPVYGITHQGYHTRVALNDGLGNYVFDTINILTDFSASQFEFYDFDGNGLEDILIRCFVQGTCLNFRTKLLMNQGNGQFVENSVLFAPGDIITNNAVGDVDNDGDLDIVISGGVNICPPPEQFFYVYQNDGQGNFLLSATTFLDNYIRGMLKFVDIDNDGDEDAINCGQGMYGGAFHSKIYLNNGSGQYSYAMDLPKEISASELLTSDMNQDSKVDLLVRGESTLGRTFRIFKNESCFGNRYFYDTITACDSFTWINNVTYTESQLIYHNVYTETGCDSIITLTLNILEKYNYLNFVQCDSLEWGDTTFHSTGTYELHHENSLGCDSIEVIDLTIMPNEVIVFNENNVLSSNCVDLDVDFQWIDCVSGVQVPGETNPYFTPQSTGEFALVVNSNNCEKISNCVQVEIVSAENIDETEVSVLIYPNPASSEINVKFSDLSDGDYEIRIFDLYGRLVIYQRSNSMEESISVENIAEGNYIIELRSSQYKFSKRLVIN